MDLDKKELSFEAWRYSACTLYVPKINISIFDISHVKASMLHKQSLLSLHMKTFFKTLPRKPAVISWGLAVKSKVFRFVKS